MLEISTTVQVFNNIKCGKKASCTKDDKLSGITGLVKLSSPQSSELVTWTEGGCGKRDQSPVASQQHDAIEKGQCTNLNQHSNTLSPKLHLQQTPPQPTSSLETATPKINNRNTRELLHAVTAIKVEEETKDDRPVKSQESTVNLLLYRDDYILPLFNEMLNYNTVP